MIDPKTLSVVIQNTYESAAGLLREASRHLEDAAGAAEAAEMDRAYGAALPAEAMVKRALELIGAAAAIREAGR